MLLGISNWAGQWFLLGFFSSLAQRFVLHLIIVLARLPAFGSRSGNGALVFFPLWSVATRCSFNLGQIRIQEGIDPVQSKVRRIHGYGRALRALLMFFGWQLFSIV
jgi:hypothetical protein